jgi:hypothetical protein
MTKNHARRNYPAGFGKTRKKIILILRGQGQGVLKTK